MVNLGDGLFIDLHSMESFSKYNTICMPPVTCNFGLSGVIHKITKLPKTISF